MQMNRYYYGHRLKITAWTLMSVPGIEKRIKELVSDQRTVNTKK